VAEQVAIVTGASSGIGEETALALHDAGYTVYAAARRTERMGVLRDRGVNVASVDVTDDGSMTPFVSTVLAECGKVDVLVNNAGYGSYGSIEDVSLDEARRQFDVNVFGLARMTQLVLPHMRARKSGYIVNISSMGGRIWEPLGGWYHATKFAVEGLSDSLRAEVSPFGINVVVIQPGSIRTEWGRIAAENLESTSRETAYAKQARLVSRGLRSSDRSRLASEPVVVADVVVRAVSRRRPRTRYPVGGGARLFLFMERVLPDRGFDRFIQLVYRFAG
jgi:NAD(P)-dependent dehydrogenase (short-subunit alcohol dehydrogenase family)